VTKVCKQISKLPNFSDPSCTSSNSITWQ